jgi:[ribosomal protein S5]-alanine N-acetyltransferase
MDTPRLVGRAVTADDLEFVARVWNDERVAPTIGGVRSWQQLEERIERWACHWEAHGFGVTLFRERTSGTPVGWGGLQHSTIGIGDRLTVGYAIAPDAWGHGYATEIARAAVAHAFDVLGVDRLYASVLSTNERSRRVLAKAGLSVHAELDHGEHAEVIYAISR